MKKTVIFDRSITSGLFSLNLNIKTGNTMKPPTSPLTALFCFLSVITFGQVSLPDSSHSEKADQFKKELSDFLSKKAAYPEHALSTKTWGDVILSCELDKSGKLSEPLILKSPDLLLSTNSIVTLNYLAKWNPEELDYIPFGKEYQFVFRYRIYIDVMPADNKERAVKLFNEAKYDKAMKAFDRAIKDNEYDHELYSFRAKCKELLGDNEGAAGDRARAEKLSNDVMAIVDVVILGRTTTRTVSGSRIVAIPAR